MAKNPNTRYDETVRFLKTTPVPTFKGDLKVLTDALDTWRLTANPAAVQQVSSVMSQEKSATRPASKQERDYRRAAILLRCVFVELPNNWAKAQKDVNSFAANASGAQVLGFALNDAYDSMCTTPTVANANINFLKADPKEFLKKYKVVVDSGGKTVSGVETYKVFMYNGVYNFKINNLNGIATLRAINIVPVDYNAVKNSVGKLPSVSSTIDNTCDLMLTTQFTGCAYCFMLSQDGTKLSVAHINPGKISLGGNDAVQMAKTLDEKGGFDKGNGGIFDAYGRVDNNSGDFGYPKSADQMIVMAVRREMKWEVYSQTSTGADWTVKRIDT